MGLYKTLISQLTISVVASYSNSKCEYDCIMEMYCLLSIKEITSEGMNYSLFNLVLVSFLCYSGLHFIGV